MNSMETLLILLGPSLWHCKLPLGLVGWGYMAYKMNLFELNVPSIVTRAMDMPFSG